MSLKNFGLFFSEVREKSGYKSQRELADASGVSHSTINRIEAGTHKASPKTLRALAKHLKGIEYEDLLEKLGYLGHENYEVREHVRQLAEKGLNYKPRIPYSTKSGTNDPSSTKSSGQAYMGGGSDWTDEEKELAKAAVEDWRRRKKEMEERLKQKD